MLALPCLRIRLERIHRILNLRPQIRTMKSSFMYLLSTALTIPPQPIQTALRPLLLQHDTHRILEPHRIMRRIWRQQKHVAFVDMYVAELFGGWERRVDDFQEHGAFVLVEPFCCFVDMVVCAFIGAADYHDGYGGVVDAVVVYGGFEHVGVFGDPGDSQLAWISRAGSRILEAEGIAEIRTILVCLGVGLLIFVVLFVRSGAVVVELRMSAIAVAVGFG